MDDDNKINVHFNGETKTFYDISDKMKKKDKKVRIVKNWCHQHVSSSNISNHEKNASGPLR